MKRGPLALAVAVALIFTACTDDGPKARGSEPITTTTTTATTIPPDAVIERTQMILTVDPGEPAALGQLASAIRERFLAAGSADTRATVIGTRVVVDARPDFDKLDVYAMAATAGNLDFRPVLGALPFCPVPLPIPTDDKPAILRARDRKDGCTHVGPSAPVTIDHAEAKVEDDHWIVAVRPTSDGLAALSRTFEACFLKDLTCPTGAIALAVDDTIQTAARADEPSYDRPEVTISGEFDGLEAIRIARVLAGPALPSSVRVIEPPVPVIRRVVGRVGPGDTEAAAVVIRYGEDDEDDLARAVEDVADAIAGQMTLLGATAVVASADVQLGELTVLIVGAGDPAVASAAVAEAAEVDDPSRVVTLSAVVG